MPIWNLSRFTQCDTNAVMLELLKDGRLITFTRDDADAEKTIADALDASGSCADLAPWALNIARKVGEISFGRK